MNNKVKVALAFIAGGALLLLNQKRRKKNPKKKNFVTPDGNSYIKDQIYRSSDGKLFKNGKPLHVETPHRKNTPLPTNQHDENVLNHYEAKPRNVEYHHKGNRHR